MFGAVDNSIWIAITGAVVALASMVTAVVTVISNNRTKRMEIAQIASDAKIATLEHNTNGIKEALVAAAKEAGVSEGKESQRVKQVEAEANIAKGVAQAATAVAIPLSTAKEV